MRSIHFKLISFLALLGILYWLTAASASDHPSVTSPGPRQSSPIALTVDDSKLVNVNPEANTVSVFDTSSWLTPNQTSRPVPPTVLGTG